MSLSCLVTRLSLPSETTRNELANEALVAGCETNLSHSTHLPTPKKVLSDDPVVPACWTCSLSSSKVFRLNLR